MTLKRLIVYKGEKSHTGLAMAKRFPGLLFEGKNETFEQIAKIVVKEPVLVALPLWNSHEGEIPETGISDMVFEKGVKIQELWPRRIKFEYIVRKGMREKDIKKVISVGVAKTQCSRFLRKKDFESNDSTVRAYEEFCRNKNFDAVLCAPGQYEPNKFIKLRDDVSNPVNFTTFVLLGKVDWRKWSGKKWSLLRKYGLPKNSVLFGFEMSVPTPTLTEEQQDLFDNITKNANSVDRIPRPVFIFKREGGRCCIIIESKIHDYLSPPFTEEGYLTDIKIKDALGETNKLYTNIIFPFINEEFNRPLHHDFVKHIGTQTCLYACPTLNILTHGFNAAVVEEVVRKIIIKYFELIDNGLNCSNLQRKLFEKYKKEYYNKGSRFIKFVSI